MDTKSIYGIDLERSRDHKETSLSRRRQDTSDKENVIQKIHSFGVLSSKTSMEFHNIARKDRATNKITESLLNAKTHGLGQMSQFVQDRQGFQWHTEEEQCSDIHNVVWNQEDRQTDKKW